MSRSISRRLAQLRTNTATRALRERAVLIRESALFHEGIRSIRLAQSDRLPFNR